MKTLILFSAILLCTFSARATTQGRTDLIVMVPGLMNSMVKGYFSHTILTTVAEESNAPVLVAEHLSPTGSLEQNAEMLGNEIRAYVDSHFAKQNPRITLIGHSSGGLYALKAAQNFPDLNIQNIYCVATPLHGDEIADKLLADRGLLDFILSLEFSKWILSTDGLFNLRTADIQNFLAKIRLPRAVGLYTIAGYQPPGSLVLPALNAKKLNTVYSYTTKLLTGKSDGLVAVSSALGEGLILPSRLGPVRAQSLSYLAPLDHIEQHIEPNLLRLFGTTNINYVRTEQQKMYRTLVRHMKAN